MLYFSRNDFRACFTSSHGMAPLGNKSYRKMTRLHDFRSKLRLNTWKIIFLPGALEMLFKDTSLDSNVGVSLEKHLFSTWSCKPGKYHTALQKLNIQTFRAKVLTNAKQIFQLSCALKYLSKEMLFASIRPALSEKRLSSR